MSRSSSVARRPEDAAVDASGIVSVIVPVLRDQPDLEEVHRAYRTALAAVSEGGGELEFVYVLDARARQAALVLSRLAAAGEPLTALAPSRFDGEAAALRIGLQHARGATVLTLSSELQVEPAELPALLAGLSGHDMVLGRRTEGDARLESNVFHWATRKLFGHPFHDLACRARACSRAVLDELAGYGGMPPHFLPLLAAERGFRILEVPVRSAGTAPRRQLNPLSQLRFVLDILSCYVLLKFLRRPLRFFGAVGLPIFAVGLVWTGSLAFARLFLETPLADRPALILGVLMIVLGIQIVALGLIGEIIIFAAGRRIKDYTVEKII